MRFVADVMVGRLARWLRIMGFDVLYFHDAADEFLLYVAKEDNRVILTRDTDLYETALRARAKAVLLSSSSSPEQLTELREKLGVSPRPFSRCAECNGLLVKVEKADVDGLVPEFVWQRHTEFWSCSVCGKIYWNGSHMENMVRLLKLEGWKP